MTPRTSHAREMNADAPATPALEPVEGAAPQHAGRKRHRAAGPLYVAASALCFGSMPIFARMAYAAGVDTKTLLLLRFSIGGAVMWAAFAARRASLPRGRALATLVAMGGIGYAGQAFSYFFALTLASAGLVALLLYLYPAIVTILSRVVLGHHLTRLQILAVAIALAGSVLTVGAAGDGKPLGIFFGALAAVVYSAYILTGSRIPASVTPTASSAIIMSSAAVVYGVVAAFRGVRLPVSGSGWVGVLAIAILTVLAIAFFLAGLERMGPVRASVYSTLEPAFTVALGALLLGEAVTPLRVAGGGLILGAVALLARSEARG